MLKALAMTLMLYASEESGYKMPDHLPTLKLASECSMSKTVFGQDHVCGDQSLMVSGMYDPYTNTLTLPTNYKRESIKFQAVLVHELVHYLQDVNKQVFGRCTGDLEREAYKVQEKWLKEHGTSLLREFRLTRMELRFMTACDGNRY